MAGKLLILPVSILVVFVWSHCSVAEPQALKADTCDRLFKEAEKLSRSNKLEQSIPLFNRLIEDSSCPSGLKCEAYGKRASAKDKLNDFNSAIADYGKALQCRPGSMKIREDLGAALFKRGNLRERLGDIKGAAGDYEKSLECKPDLQEARFQLSTILCNRGRKAEKNGDVNGAVASYKKALKFDPHCRDAVEALKNIEEQKENRSRQKDAMIVF